VRESIMKKIWIARINDKWKMTWIEPDGIADRDLYWYEKIRYFYKFFVDYLNKQNEKS
jgi:hypothetical protein